MLRRLAIIAAAAAGLVLVPTGPASAGDGWTNVTCGQLPQPGCEVGAGTLGKRPRPVRPVSDSGGDGVCHDALGRPAPCVHPEYGWMGSDGCYYQAAPDFRPPPGYEGGASGGSGAWHVVRCPGVTPYMSWLPNGAGAAPPSPAVLARQALDRLVLPSPRIRAFAATNAGHVYSSSPTRPVPIRTRPASPTIPGGISQRPGNSAPLPEPEAHRA